jgi:diguanylate cyclase (GGDEF)-like protein
VLALEGFISDITERKQAEQRLAHLAQFDPLTGLPNRTLLHDRLSQTVAQAQRQGRQAAMLFVDLDRFKLINDTLGHHVGDLLIAEVARRLLRCVRAGDTVGRISGDEFGVVLADLAHADDAALVAQKVLEALAAPYHLAGSEAFTSASIGIAVCPGDGTHAEDLLRNADMAMYRAKESTRNAYCFFTPEMNQRASARMQLNNDLRHAIERREFVLHYQPKVDLVSGRMQGMEALLRWNHPARGLVPPMEFVPALEDSGLILPVGEWVLEEACAQIGRWQAAGLAPVPVAINLSAKQFRRRDLDDVVARALAAAGVAPELLELEITESSLMDDPEQAVRLLGSLRRQGVRISVDDFGTGYSSLSYLTRLPLSALKIDRSFVRDAMTNPEAASIVRAIIDMAHNLRFTVIAEGVETEQQVAFLRQHACDQAQGFLYGRPAGADQVRGRLAPVLRRA